MIPFASCMCFQGKGAQWTSTPGKRRTNAEVIETSDHKICICISEKPDVPDAVRKKRPDTISESEWCLLHALEQCPSPWRPTTTFQTPQRKRCRPRLPIIRADALRSALLDDAYQGVTTNLLDGCGHWAFNTFHLDVSTGGRSLSVLMVHLFQQYNFFQHFHLDPVKVWRCFNLFESCYHASNPYHNSVHAADVTQAMHCFLQEKKISSCISPVEALSAILAAVTHDLDHPGVNQPFLIATSNHLATLYKNFSVLENHHWRMAISCLREAQLFDHLDKDICDEIEHNIHSLILATDITRQQEFLAKFKRYLENDALDLMEPQHRHFILQIALKCADLCNPCRPWAISHCWSQQVCLEFYKQGEYEKRLNLPVTPICDRTRSTIAKIQADFFRFVVTPLFEVWHGFLSSELSIQLIRNLHNNQQCWELKAKQALEAAAAKAVPTISPVSEQPSPLEGDEESDCSPTDGTLRGQVLPSFGDEDLSVTPWCHRRCSMPLSIPKLLPCTTLRRQSFPHSSQAVVTPGDLFQIHRSPHVSLRTLSAEQLQPRTSIVSLSNSGAMTLLGLIARENQAKRLVHQPASYPPFSYAPSLKEPGKGRSSIPSSSKEISARHSGGGGEDLDAAAGGSGGDVVHAQSAGGSEGQSSISQLNNVIPNVENHTSESTNQDVTLGGHNTNESECDSTTAEGQCVRSMSCSVHRTISDPSEPPPSVHTLTKVTSLVQKDSEYLLGSWPSGADGVGSASLWCTPFGDPNDEDIQKESSLLESATSWCSQVSRSMSQERPEPPSRDFDSPATSWKSSSSSLSSCTGAGLNRLLQRRGSAPVSTGTHPIPSTLLAASAVRESNATQRHPYNYGRRWSLAAESMPYAGIQVDCSDGGPTPRPFCRELVRRHSFGILEPFAAVPSSESENDGSSTEPTSTGTTCSTRRSSTVISIHATRGQMYDPSSDLEAGSCSSESHDVFPTCLRPPPHLLGRRRGSLPADIPISLVTRISSYASSVMPIPGSTDSIAHVDFMTGTSPWRRSSAGEVLGAFIGPSSSILAGCAKPLGPPSAASFSGVRRGSGGIDLGCGGSGGAGLWHSSTGVFSSWQNVCGVSKAARTKCTPDFGASEDIYMVRRHLVGLSSGIAGVSPQRWWRGSAPFDLSLLSSASSGNLASGGLED